MKILQFRCKLLSDVILNQKAATEGNQDTLSFIPGNNFLGIVAKAYNQFSTTEQAEIFHSGSVRFGDAHPIGKDEKTRSLHIPASLFYPKLKGLDKESFIRHFYHRNDDHRGKDGAPQQLKQCREGFYVFNTNNSEATVVNMSKSFSLKSAYDRDQRRSKDSQIYGYEALEKGGEFLFSVEVDDDNLANAIEANLIGIKHIGRSRTAQYGLVDISKADFDEQASQASTFQMDGQTYITVYADGRLIFLDEAGMTTFRPTATQLGLDGEIDWEKSQVRTFQYAPWNGKRQTRDCDRAGFEKGSVFVVRLKQEVKVEQLPSYVGNYRNEGFGKVVYGWNMLQKAGANGMTDLKFAKQERDDAYDVTPLSGTPLLSFLAKKQKEENATDLIYKNVNDFVNNNKRLFAKSSFASQWGTIREIAIQNDSAHKLIEELFDKQIKTERKASPTDSRTQVMEKRGYITHGIKSKEWTDKGRGNILRRFIEEMGKTEFGDLAQRALVNLASEMAKQNK